MSGIADRRFGLGAKGFADEETAKPRHTLARRGTMASKPRVVRFSRLVDLSQTVGPDTPMFPAYPAPTFTQWTTREAHGFFAESLFLVSHTGTHVDAPFHFEPNGRKLHEIPLQRFIAPGAVLDLRGLKAKERITPGHVKGAIAKRARRIARGDAVLLRTGWERRSGTPAYLFDNPGLSGAAARLLIARGVGLVGIDTANVDHPNDTSYPAHHTLLRANVPIVENVANLAALRDSPFFLVALPLKLLGTSGSPIRLVALVE